LLEEAYAANWFTNFGALSKRLEARLTEAFAGPGGCCVVTANGTAAIAAPLIAAGVRGPGLASAFTFRAAVSAIRMAGCEPAPVDVSPNDWVVSPAALDAALAATGARAAVLVVPFGVAHDFAAHAAAAAKHGAVLVIDNASGLGRPRAPLEADAHVIETFSMHATKPFGVGEGGVIFAAASWEQRLRAAINFGAPQVPDLPPWGVNGKMSEFHAAIGLAVAEGFAERLPLRQALVARYRDLADATGVGDCPRDPNASVWQSFPIALPSAVAAEAFLSAAVAHGVEVRRFYHPALSQIPGVAGGACPVAESLASRVCGFPVYGRRTAAEEAILLGALQAALAAAARASR